MAQGMVWAKALGMARLTTHKMGMVWAKVLGMAWPTTHEMAPWMMFSTQARTRPATKVQMSRVMWMGEGT